MSIPNEKPFRDFQGALNEIRVLQCGFGHRCSYSWPFYLAHLSFLFHEIYAAVVLNLFEWLLCVSFDLAMLFSGSGTFFSLLHLPEKMQTTQNIEESSLLTME